MTTQEKYESFLAVPIMRGIRRIGVMVVQGRKKNYFTDEDVQVLRAITAQLATTIETAKLLASFNEQKKVKKTPTTAFNLKFVQGKVGAEGAAYGETAILDDQHLSFEFDPALLQKKLSDTSQVLDKINKKANDLSLGKQNYDNLKEGIKDKISQAVPDTVQLRSLTQTLEQTAKIHEASVSALQIQPLVIETKVEGKLGTLTEIQFTFNVEGEYKNLIALLQDLKTSSRLISIDTLSLSKLSEESTLVMSLSGKGYYLKWIKNNG